MPRHHVFQRRNQAPQSRSQKGADEEAHQAEGRQVSEKIEAFPPLRKLAGSKDQAAPALSLPGTGTNARRVPGSKRSRLLELDSFVLCLSPFATPSERFLIPLTSPNLASGSSSD